MKKIYRNILIASIVIFIISLFSISVGKFISKYHELGEIDMDDKVIVLKKSELKLKNVRTLQFETVKLSNISIINFWASWCKPCIDEQPGLELLADNNKAIKFYQLSFDSIDKQIQVIEKYKWKIPAFLVEDTLIFSQPIILPITYILKDSMIVKRIYGSTNWQDTAITNFIKSL